MLARLKSALGEKSPRAYQLLRKLKHHPVPLGLRLLNFIVQRIFRVNGNVPWMVNYTSKVTVPERIEFGDNVWICFATRGGCYIQGANGIKIGNNTRFAFGVKIISANHDPRDLNRWLETGPIEIGNSCWIGANAVILPGVKLGDRCVVGAGAVVTKSFAEGNIIAGVPGKSIGHTQFADTDICDLMDNDI
jgi:acetyltransferase-like isoleucine patch superfamily enzyme